MKIWQGLLIFGSIFVILVQIIIATVVILLDLSWWVFFIPLLFFFIIFLGILVGGLIVFFFKRKPEVIQIDLSSARERAKHDMKYDTDNPDNFVIKKYKLFKVGREGETQTPIIVFDGYGTEFLERRVIIINLNNSEKESSLMIDPTEEEIKEAVVKIADYPPEYIQEEKVIGADRFGNPIIGKSTRPSYTEIKKSEEKAKAEEVSKI